MKRSGGRLAEVKSIERSSDDGVHGVDVQVDAGDEEVTAEHYGEPGVDALPLPGDQALLQAAEGAGAETVSEYLDPKNEGKSLPGERREYARDADGNVAAEFWIKGNGDVAITSIKAGGKIILNGVEIDQQGNITTPGDVTAVAGTAEVPLPGVKLSTHLHGTGVGPTTGPTPGT